MVQVLFLPTSEANSSNVSCGYVSIVEDKLGFEGEELFTVSILPHATAMVGGNNTADVIILDNDGTGRLLALWVRKNPPFDH